MIDFSLLILTAIYDFGIYDSRYLNALKPIRVLRILISMRVINLILRLERIIK